MRSIRKAIFEDISGLSHCDTEFWFGSRHECVDRAIRRGGGYSDNLDQNDPEIVYYKAVNARGSGVIDL